MSNIERRASGSLLASKSVSGATGKVMVVGGSAAIAVSLLASLIPFVGVMGVAALMIALGLFMWE